MRLNKGDLVFVSILATIAALIAHPKTNAAFLVTVEAFPYFSGFVKFLILGNMGEMLTGRIFDGVWKRSAGFGFRMLVWGVLGILVTLEFQMFGGGVAKAMESGYLPGLGSTLVYAFFASIIMNVLCAPIICIYHKFADVYIELKFDKKKESIGLRDLVSGIDWYSFIDFVILKTIPYFWFPIQIVTFLLPSEYRVLFGAFLSMAFGAILAFANRKKIDDNRASLQPIGKI